MFPQGENGGNPADVNSNNISWKITCILITFITLMKIFHEIFSVITHGGFRLLARIVRQTIKKWRYINITPGRWYIHVLCVTAWLTGLKVKDGLFLSPLCYCVGGPFNHSATMTMTWPSNNKPLLWIYCRRLSCVNVYIFGFRICSSYGYELDSQFKQVKSLSLDIHPIYMAI